MKLKTLLVLCVSTLMSISAFADWTKPVPKTQELIKDGVTAQYLYNVGAGMFFRGANDYMTRASVDAQVGYPVKISVTNVDDDLVCIIDSVFKFSEYRKTFVEGASAIWVDNNSGANCDTWQFTSVDGYYKISNTKFPDEYLGVGMVDGSVKDSRLYLTSYFTSQDPVIEASYEWASVSREAYKEYFKLDSIYNAAMDLKNAIDEAKSKYPSIDLAEEEAVYNNTSSDKATLEAAIVSVKQKFAKAVEEDVTYDNPKDMTSSITNPSFETGDTKGWTVSSSGSSGSSSDCAAHENTNATYTIHNADGDYIFNIWAYGYPITQKVSNLPNGVYSLSAVVASSTDCTNIYLTAVSAADSIHHAVALEGGEADGTSYTKQTWGTPGSFFFPVSDNTATIGAVGCAADGVSYLAEGRWWYKVDNFRLTYYGNKANSWAALLDDYKTGCTIAEDAVVTGSVKEDYESVVSEATASDYETYSEALKNIKASKVLVDENMTAWTNYTAAITKVKNLLGDGESIDTENEAVQLLSDEKDEYEDNISDLELTTEDLNDKIATIDSLINVAKDALKKGADMGDFLVNADFSNGTTGWQGGVTVNSYCGEKYGKGAFDVYQEVKDLPVGVYQISMQGFYRQYRDDDNGKTAWYNYFESTEDAYTKKVPAPDTLAYVYLNDMKTALNCVYDFKQDLVNDGSDNYTCAFYGSTGYSKDPYNKYAYPNDMASAALAFADGAYKVSAYGIVAKKGDVMRIGVKGNLIPTSTANHWAIFDNFKLTYQAKDNDCLDKILADTKVKLININKIMGSEVYAEAQKNINFIKNATAADDPNEKFTTLAAYYECTSAVDASVLLFDTLVSKKKDIESFLGNEAAKEEETEQFQRLSEIFEELDGLAPGQTTLTNADARTKIAEIDTLTAQLKEIIYQKGIENATIEKPFDVTEKFVVNPSFEKGNFTGWKSTGFATQNNTSFGKTGTYYCEKWHTVANLDVNQTVKGLPCGTYKLAVDDYCDEVVKGTLYAKVSNDSLSTLFSNHTSATAPATDTIYIYVPESDSLKIGAKGTLTSSTWCCLDNFKLYMVGLGKDVTVHSLTLNSESAELEVKETLTLTPTIEGTEYPVKWSSSDETVATVKDGVVTAVKIGTATITCSCLGKVATCEITVKAVTPKGDDPLEFLTAKGSAKAAIDAVIAEICGGTAAEKCDFNNDSKKDVVDLNILIKTIIAQAVQPNE